MNLKTRLILPGLLLTALSFTYWSEQPVSASTTLAAPTPTPTQAGRPRTASTPSPTATPVSVPSPTPVQKPVQTLEELQAKIRQRLFDPLVRRGRVGVKVASLNSGKVIFDQDSEKYFMPASNQKNFTVATAIEKLGPDFKFVTSVYANSLPDQAGTVKGDLRIYGRGDVSISTAFFGTSPNDPDTYFKGIDRLVDRIVTSGVKRIEGSIVGDESYFKGFHIPGSWEWDDLQFYYGAEVSALPINDNAVDIAVTPGPSGGACNFSVSPPNSIFQISNLCTTSGSQRRLSVVKRIDRNVIEITGTMPSNDDGYRTSIAITKPAELFVALLKRRLEHRGITVTGTSRVLPPNIPADPAQIEIAKLESVPLSTIAAKTMKPSQNMFTETLLWTLGEQSRNGNTAGDSSTLGINAVKAFLKEIGVPDDGIIPYDGSGLSRHNLITPSAVVTLYSYMAKSKNAQIWRDSLTIAGVDGTLANRMKGTVAEANFRGKTGTIDQVSALSGYVTTAAGEQLVVSILVNNVGGPTRTRTSLADDIATALASFNGRID